MLRGLQFEEPGREPRGAFIDRVSSLLDQGGPFARGGRVGPEGREPVAVLAQEGN